jgi:hypothetical protein
MSQISPPIRILALCAVGFLAAWMLFLKPGEPAVEPVAAPAGTPAVAAGGAPAQTGPGRVAEAANDLKANAARSTGSEENAVGGTPAAPAAGSAPAATGAAATPAVAADSKAMSAAVKAGMPARIIKAIEKRKIVVLLFWNPKAADDQAVRKEMRQADAYRKKTVFATAKISDIARYGQITRGVDVKQSPTVVVVDRKLNAEALVGYQDRAAIEQAISDALRASRK